MIYQGRLQIVQSQNVMRVSLQKQKKELKEKGILLMEQTNRAILFWLMQWFLEYQDTNISRSVVHQTDAI